LALVKVGDKWGYIDRSGKMVIKPQFDAAESFFEGSAKLIIGGCIDKAGRMVINAQFDDAEGVTSGLARVSNGDKSNYIDKEGKHVLGPTNQFQLKHSGDSPLKGPYESRQVPADDSRQRTFTGHLNIYYDAVMACIGDAESILTFGPGEAKAELKKRVDKKGVGGRIAGIETVD